MSSSSSYTSYMNQVKNAIETGTREVRHLATEVGNEVKKTAENNKVNSPLPADVGSEIQKVATILAGFTGKFAIRDKSFRHGFFIFSWTLSFNFNISFTLDPANAEGGLDNVIPAEVVRHAKGLAVFTVVKAGFVWSGRVGSGLVIARLEDGSKYICIACFAIIHLLGPVH